MTLSRLSLPSALVYLLLPFARAQDTSSTPTSTLSEPQVPTRTPIPGNYDGPLRPQVHFSPPQGFMNDPNGMFLDEDGLYHLYYQYNPTDTVAGNQHWGHATSRNLYDWTNEPIALFPADSTEGIFSGSAVIDVNNTSGFFPNQTNGVVAIYTLNTPDRQVQDIAYSLDGGYSFTKYAGNPVIPSTSNQFRDPKVIWYEPTGKWVMVVAYPVDFEIGIFSSPDLIAWTPESNFSYYAGWGDQYECPNLVEMRVEGDETLWVLTISINPGAPLGGSITEYFVGEFDGRQFTAWDTTTRLTDFAKDNYAGQFFYNVPAVRDQIGVNWASNWQYTNEVPTAQEGWRSAMSVPRGYYLKDLGEAGVNLISYPYRLNAVIEEELASNPNLGNGVLFVDYSNLESGALYFEANITGSSLAGNLEFAFNSAATGESVTGGTSVPSGEVWLDRGQTKGFSHPDFTSRFNATGLYDGNEAWRISGIVDRSVIEVFLNGGELSASSVFFPTQPLDSVALTVSGLSEGATASVGVWGLRATWSD